MRRAVVTLVRLFVALIFSSQAFAECGGNTQCIGVGATPQEAEVAHHGLGPATFTLDFGNQVIATTSSAKTIYVAAVTGPTATQATLGNISITGTDSSQFSIVGGSCLTMGPIQGGADCAILVAFNPSTVGAKSATVHVPLNPPACPGCLTERTVLITGSGALAPPSAQEATLSARANTPTALDLSPFISGAELAGIRIVSEPSHGTATVSGNVVTYTPRDGYLGVDAFSYETYSAAATSPTAVVTISVVPRPNPAAEPHVVSLVASQGATAHRFALAQIGNISRRLESLHRRPSQASRLPSPALSRRWQGLRNLAAQAETRSVASFPGDRIAVLGSAEQQVPRVGALPTEVAQGAHPEAMSAVDATVSRLLINLATTSSIPVLYHGEPSYRAGRTLAGGFWTDGMIGFGKRDASAASSGISYTTSGVTAGYDARFSDALIVGMGVGYARDGAALGTDGSSSKNQGRSISLYGSYQPVPDFYFDGLLGYGHLDSQAERYVAGAGSYGLSERGGDQLFGSIAGGYQFQQEHLLFSPYGRLDFSSGKLDKTSESGAGLSSLTYFEQKLKSLRVVLGLRAQSEHETDFGLAVPRIRAEYGHELSSDGSASIAYADMETGPSFTVTPVGTNRSSLLLGVGSELLMTDGLILGFDFSATRHARDYTDHTMRIWLSASLDDKPKLGGLMSRLSRIPISLEAGFRWDDNVSRTGGISPKLGDGTYFLGAGIAKTIPTSEHTQLKLGGTIDTDKFETHEKLDNLSLGVDAELQYRSDGHFKTPIFGAFARANWDETRSEMRRGHRASVGVDLRAPLTDRMQLFGALARNNRYASSTLFDTRDVSAKINLDYQLSNRGTLYVGGEHRRGDAVSSGLPMADSAAIAKVFVPDDAFPGLMGYRYAARTTIWTLGYNFRLGNRDSLDFSWRHATARPTQEADYTGLTGYPGLGAPGTAGSTTYTAQQFALSYLMRF